MRTLMTIIILLALLCTPAVAERVSLEDYFGEGYEYSESHMHHHPAFGFYDTETKILRLTGLVWFGKPQKYGGISVMKRGLRNPNRYNLYINKHMGTIPNTRIRAPFGYMVYIFDNGKRDNGKRNVYIVLQRGVLRRWVSERFATRYFKEFVVDKKYYYSHNEYRLGLYVKPIEVDGETKDCVEVHFEGKCVMRQICEPMPRGKVGLGINGGGFKDLQVKVGGETEEESEE